MFFVKHLLEKQMWLDKLNSFMKNTIFIPDVGLNESDGFIVGCCKYNIIFKSTWVKNWKR